MQTWQLQEAKNRLSEVVDKALDQGPQVITRRGVETAILLSVKEYRTLRRPDTDLVDFFKPRRWSERILISNDLATRGGRSACELPFPLLQHGDRDT